ncbi:hypothetical protein D1AOALGA4SA_812 [Olavius algarvensis Delta 1 endosymbiont]|nr:hypothetical protein D1AOALGA4SA_812 [Olavius algarvensis Delta 1 endosymbiont]
MNNDGFASLSRFKIDRIHYSMFDVGRSMFDVRRSLVSFLRSDWPFFWPEAVLL